jgi:hypothetical protein
MYLATYCNTNEQILMKVGSAVRGSLILTLPALNITAWQTFQVVRWEWIVNSEERNKFVGRGLECSAVRDNDRRDVSKIGKV